MNPVLRELQRQLNDIAKQLAALQRQETVLSNPVTYSGTPTANSLACWTGAGTVAAATFGTADVVLTSGNQTVAGNKTFTGFTSVGDGSTDVDFNVNGAASTVRQVAWRTNNSLRWIIRANSDAESGSNAGSRLEILSRTDAGGALRTDLAINRATGEWTINGNVALAGISFGNETLANYDQGTWSPAITGSGSNPTVTYTTQAGRYTRIGDMVFYRVNIVINTISGGSGDVRISLPSTAAGNDAAPVLLHNVDMPGTPISVVAYTRAANANFVIYSIQDNGAVSALQVSGLAAGDIIAVSGFYFV